MFLWAIPHYIGSLFIVCLLQLSYLPWSTYQQFVDRNIILQHLFKVSISVKLFCFLFYSPGGSFINILQIMTVFYHSHNSATFSKTSHSTTNLHQNIARQSSTHVQQKIICVIASYDRFLLLIFFSFDLLFSQVRIRALCVYISSGTFFFNKKNVFLN